MPTHPVRSHNPMTSARDYKSESRREFDKVAPDYDKNSAFYYRITRWCDDAVIDRIGKIDKPFERILDVGCGTGVLLHKLSQLKVRLNL